jgi:DNA ligase-1
MNQPWKIIAAIEVDNSRLAKEAIVLQEAMANNTVFFEGVRLAYDATVTFGVKQIPEKLNEDGPGLDWDSFNRTASLLRNRDLTGHAARDAVLLLVNQATKEQWNGWYRLILIKDMKAGFSESTINRVCEKKFPQFAITVFECQLAKDCVDDEGNVDESELQGKKILDTKLDGMRTLTIAYPNGKVDQFSRNGKELLNFTMIKEQIAKVIIASNLEEAMVFDAEVMSKNFQDLMKQSRRKTDIQTDDAVLNLIDIMTLKEFQAGVCKSKQKHRLEMLHNWYNKHADDMPNVAVLGYEIVDLDTQAGRDRLLEVNKAALDAKAEGIMLKDPEAIYECKRSKNWLKMKPFLTMDLKVVDVEEGKPDSKFKGSLGALVCEGIDQGRKIRVNVGGGYSIQLRSKLWADYTGKPVTWKKKVGSKWVTYTEQPSGDTVVGQIAEIKADAVTKSDSSDTYSLRFPRFLKFRFDKSIDQN